MKSEKFTELERILGKGRVKRDVVLAPYSTFKTGGPAEFYFETGADEELIAGVHAAHLCDISYTVLGGASNVIIGERGIKGLVIKNLVVYKKILEEKDGVVKLKVSSGYSVTRLVRETTEEGLSGFEYHLGLPGTVGGALYMNSKWTKPVSYIGDHLVKAKLVNSKGKVRCVEKKYFKFAYDSSTLQQTREIVIWAIFKLVRDDPKLLKKRAKKALEYRKKTQPFGIATSGCFFKNVGKQSAGELIDKLGLKGYRIGDAYISKKHANFILNEGSAKSRDVKKLVSYVKKKVRNKYGIELEEEVILL